MFAIFLAAARRHFYYRALGMGLFLACMTPIAAMAQNPCHTRQEMIARLAERYGEVPLAAGVTANGGLLEVLAGPNGATWSILITTPRGQSCLVAAGEGWRSQGIDGKDKEPTPKEQGA